MTFMSLTGTTIGNIHIMSAHKKRKEKTTLNTAVILKKQMLYHVKIILGFFSAYHLTTGVTARRQHNGSFCWAEYACFKKLACQ